MSLWPFAFRGNPRWSLPERLGPPASSSGLERAGIIVSDRVEVFFDTLAHSRKAVNLRHNPAIALAVGSNADGAERSVQLEGIADEPRGADLDRLLALYFATFPDGRERQTWPAITYFRVTPTWLRYSNYAAEPPLIVELSAADLARA